MGGRKEDPIPIKAQPGKTGSKPHWQTVRYSIIFSL
jgi:hypothetical protein